MVTQGAPISSMDTSFLRPLASKLLMTSGCKVGRRTETSRVVKRGRAIQGAVLLVGMLVFSRQAYARPVTISHTNIARFEVLRETYVCYHAPQKERQLGVINRAPLRVGRMWRRREDSDIRQELKHIAKLKRGATTRTRSGLERQERKLKAERAKLPALVSQCRSGDDPTQPTDQFRGDANSLLPYREELTPSEISHLLAKVAFGGSVRLRAIGASQGLSALVDTLFVADEGTYQDALWWGEDARYTVQNTGMPYWHTRAVQVAATYEALFTESPFLSRMALLFWHPHFATNLSRVDVGFSHDGIHSKNHWELLRRHATGNFLLLADALLLDVAMNRWLNNEDNRVGAPNQNFAREYMELFSLGTVDPISRIPNYDERTIDGATAFMSGFFAEYPGEDTPRIIRFDADLRDLEPYTIFPGVPGAEITQSLTPQGFMNHIAFRHPGAPRYLAERLFAQLVRPAVPETIVAELAQDILENQYNLEPVLRKILRSQAMFSAQSRSVCYLSPYDSAVSFARKFGMPAFSRDEIDPPGDDDAPREKARGFFWTFLERCREAGQSIFEPPSVFAWKGSCGLNRDGLQHYGEGFISEYNLLKRSALGIDLVNWIPYVTNIDYRQFLPSRTITPRETVTTLARHFFDLTLNDAQVNALVGFLLHDKQSDGSLIELEFDLNDDWYARRKLGALVSLLFDLPSAQRR